jgi:Predicted transcriptional regulators
MMTGAYGENYLYDAQNNLGDMMNYAVRDCGYDADVFFTLFLASGIAYEFGKGNPKYIAGLSGIELVKEVVFQVSGKILLVKPPENMERSPQYWAGWVFAYYQWRSGYSFALLHKAVPFSQLLVIYSTLHEADVEKFAELCDQRIREYKENTETSLARIRKARGYSQKQLAEVSGVALRMIQLYEQKQNDLSRAQGTTLLHLSRFLGCGIEDLME